MSEKNQTLLHGLKKATHPPPEQISKVCQLYEENQCPITKKRSNIPKADPFKTLTRLIRYYSIYVQAFQNSSVRRPMTTKPYSGLLTPTNPSVWMGYKGQSIFGIIAIHVLYIYQACKTLFGPIKPTNPSVRKAYKGQVSFGKAVCIV